MAVSEDEKLLINLVAKKSGWTVEHILRRSPRPYDIEISGKAKIGTFSAWLPLAAIHDLIEWYSPEVANLTSYPEITRSGDWSGVRDSTLPQKWLIFQQYVIPYFKEYQKGYAEARTKERKYKIKYLDPEDPMAEKMKTWYFPTREEAEEWRKELMVIWEAPARDIKIEEVQPLARDVKARLTTGEAATIRALDPMRELELRLREIIKDESDAHAMYLDLAAKVPFEDVATAFQEIARDEKRHEETARGFLRMIEQGELKRKG